MASLLDVFNAAADLTSSTLSVFDAQNRELAETKLHSQKLELSRFMADVMQDFSTRTDWENFQKDWNNAFRRKYNDYNGHSGKFAYKDQYTAKMGNQMMDQLKATGDIEVSKLVLQGKRNETFAEKNNQLELLENEAPSQERFNAQAGILDELYKGNYIDYGKYTALKQDVYKRTQKELTSNWLFDEVRKNPRLLDKTDKELSEYAMNKAPKVEATLRGADGTEKQLAVNRRSVNDEALKAVKIKVRDEQEKQARLLERDFLDINESVMWGKESAESIVKGIQKQIGYITGLDGVRITDDAKTQEVKRLEGLLQAVTNAATGGSGAKADARKKAFLNMIKDDTENIVDKILNGMKNLNGIEGYENYNEGLLSFEQVIQNAAAESGLSEKELNDFYPRLLNDFTIAVQKRAKELNPDLNTALEKLKKVPDRWAKNKIYKDNPELLEADRSALGSYVMRAISAMDANDVDVKKIDMIIDEYFEKRTSNVLQHMESDPEKAAKAYRSDRGFARAIEEAEGGLSFYNLAGKPQFIGDGDTEEKLRALEKEEQKKLLSILPDVESVVPQGYEKVGMGQTSVMVWKAGDNLYKYSTDEKGKPLLLTKDGDEWVRYEGAATEKQAKKARNERMEKERDTMLKSETMPDFSAVREKIPVDLQNFTQDRWTENARLGAEAGIENRRLVDAILNEKYFGSESTGYKTEKEETRQRTRTTGYAEEVASQESKEREREKRKSDVAQIQERSEEIRREGLPEGKVLVRSSSGGVISAVDKDKVPRGYVTVDWDSLTASQKKDVADSLAETEVYGKIGGKR